MLKLFFPILYTAPTTALEEAEQLAIVLRGNVRHVENKEIVQLKNQSSSIPHSHTASFPVSRQSTLFQITN